MGCCFSSGEQNPNAIDLSHFVIHRVLGRGGFGKVTAVELKSSGNRSLFAMKALKKELLLEKSSNFETCWQERKIMSQFHSNFLVSCYHAFQDDYFLYLIMPLMEGGDLRYYLKKNGPFQEKECLYYICQIILALEEIHSLDILYRDIKPENILLDADGNCRLSDFGLSYQISKQNKANADGKTTGYCGTPGYIAPEIMKKCRYNQSVDYFSFGILLYELLHDRLPKLGFYKKLRLEHKKEKEGGGGGGGGEGNNNNHNHNNGLINGRASIGNGLLNSEHRAEDEEEEEIYFSSRLSAECVDFIKGLLIADPEKRLGCRPGASGWSFIKSHPWLASVDFEAVAAKKLKPPFQPELGVANCDPVYELEEQIMNSGSSMRTITNAEQARFIGWEFQTKRHPDGSGRFLDSHTLDYDFTIDNNNNRHFEYSRTTAPADPWDRADRNPLDEEYATDEAPPGRSPAQLRIPESFNGGVELGSIQPQLASPKGGLQGLAASLRGKGGGYQEMLD